MLFWSMVYSCTHTSTPLVVCAAWQRQHGLSGETIYSNRYSWMPGPPYCYRLFLLSKLVQVYTYIYIYMPHCRKRTFILLKFFQNVFKLIHQHFSSTFDSMKHAVSGQIQTTLLLQEGANFREGGRTVNK